MALTREEAARILDPATRREALLPYALDGAYRLKLIREAGRMGAEALRAKTRIGTWVADKYEYCRCSECGWEWDEPEMVTPYCPSCGARMEEVLKDGNAEKE